MVDTDRARMIMDFSPPFALRWLLRLGGHSEGKNLEKILGEGEDEERIGRGRACQHRLPQPS